MRWTGLVLLLSTAVVGGVVDLSDERFMIGFLALVGVGWNAAVLGGSTLLVNSTPLEVRPDTEAIGEVAMGLAAAAGAPGAGLLVVLGGFGALCLASALAVTATLAFFGASAWRAQVVRRVVPRVGDQS